MPRKAESIKLSNDELSSLKTILRRGAAPARTQTRARVLDLLHRGPHPNSVAETRQVSGATVFNIKRRYLEAGLDAALFDQPRPGRPPTLDGKMRAQITALACSRAPEGHAGWTLRLLADKAVELGFVASISHTGIRKLLKKTASSRTSTSRGA